MNRAPRIALLLVATVLAPTVALRKDAETPAIDEYLLSGLKLRGIGPASRSGRIADVTIDPNDRSTWYMAVASGNAFKTTNRGTTWEPIFENYPVYSTSPVVVDPTNSNVVWLGTGENDGQRSVPYGNGVYRSRDAGGTRLTLTTAEGRQTDQITGGGSYLSAGDPRAHFGLGEVARVEEIRIRWPSGNEEVLRDIPANRILQVTEGRPSRYSTAPGTRPEAE